MENKPNLCKCKIGIAAFLLLTGIFSAIKIFSALPAENSIFSPSATMKISSPAFADSASIPSRYTCDGQNISPPLQIGQVPAEAKSLALVLHDPDAPAPGGFTHWVVWNIPPQTKEIPENALPMGAVQGRNGTGKSQWTAPCPPSGTHRYQFTLYALDTVLNIPSSTDQPGLEKAMQGHILAQQMLVGLYQRK